MTRPVHILRQPIPEGVRRFRQKRPSASGRSWKYRYFQWMQDGPTQAYHIWLMTAGGTRIRCWRMYVEDPLTQFDPQDEILPLGLRVREGL